MMKALYIYMKFAVKVIKLVSFHSIFWSVAQLTIAQAGTRIPQSFFIKHAHWFNTFAWEKRGKIWQQWFKVHRWKSLIPEGHRLNQNIYDKSQLHQLNQLQIERLIIEMRRAEFIHWISMIPVLFFIKSSNFLKIINIFYAVLANLPIIIAQRYNRPRLQRVLQLLKRRGEWL